MTEARQTKKVKTFEDSILAFGVYAKQFDGGFQNQEQQETFNVNGEDITRSVEILSISDETSTIVGFEATAAHAFTYLPGILSGLGFNVSYNYAASDFEFESQRLGSSVLLDENGEIALQSNGEPDVTQGFIDPANLPGLSEHTASGRVYLDVGKASFTAIGKYRSEFFQQFIGTPGNLRFIDDAFVVDARFSYKINDNFKFSLEGTNIFNEARTQFNPVADSFAEINVFGPRYFAGITAKF